MGQLTNLYVSSSYQGLLKMTDSTTGVTNTLQTVQTGDGTNTPLQISQTEVNISGTFTINGSPVSNIDTGSFVTTSSFNAYTSSVDTHLAGLDVETGSLQNQINQKLDTGSFNSYTSSVDTKLAGLDIETGSLQNQINGLATTSSLTSLSSSIASTDLSQDNRITALENVTGSINRNGLITTGSIGGSQSITGSLNVEGTISATSASFTYVNTVYETASVIYSSGSNQLGDASNDTQILYGTVRLPNGPLDITGSVSASATIATADGYLGGYLRSFVNLTASGDQIVDIKTNTTNNNGKVRLFSGGGYPFSVDITGSLNASGSQHTIVGNTLLTGALKVSSSATYDIELTGSMVITRPVGSTSTSQLVVTSSLGSTQIGPAFYELVASNTQNAAFANGLGVGMYNTNTLDELGLTIDPVAYSISGGTGNSIYVNDPTDSYPAMINFQNKANWTDGRITLKRNTDISGSLRVTNGITGSLEGTASYATNALSASWAPQPDVSYFATTGSNNFVGTENITGSVNISGSLNVNGNTSLNIMTPNVVKQNLVILGSPNSVTSSAVLNNYLNAVTTSLDNDDVNFALTPGSQLGGAGLQVVTGSYFISGSNNFIMSLGSLLAPSQGRRNILGNANLVQTAGPSINTSSLTIPVINNNYFGNSLTLTLTTGSNQGNNSHQFSSNILLGSMTWNHPSASIVVPLPSSVLQNINVGNITSTTNGPTILSGSATFNNNINAHPQLNLNHQSSSIQTTNNIFGGGGAITFNNRYYTTGSSAALTVSANLINGQGVTINAAGSPSTNVSRGFVGNLVGGQNLTVSLEQNNTDLGGLRNSIVYGYQLNVTGSHTTNTTTQQGAAFFGRYNGEDNGLADSARTVFAVGTGNSTSNRRTSFYVTSGSLVGVSGSLIVSGGLDVSGGITGSIDKTGLITTGSLAGSQTILGTLRISGSSPLQVGPSNNVGQIKTFGGSNWLYRSADTYNTVVGNAGGVDNGFFAGSEKNMVFNGFFSPFATGSNNVIIQGGGDGFTSGSNNIFIGNHDGHAGGFDNILIGGTSYSSGSIFNGKFEINVQGNRILHKQSSDALQIGDDTQVTGSLQVSNGLNVSGSVYIQSGSNFSNDTGSALVSWDATTGKLAHTPYSSVLPALFSVGAFYSTGSVTTTANTSGSFTYDTTLGVNSIYFNSGSHINVDKTATYNFQFSVQISQGAGSADVAIWLKKNGNNVSDTATYVTVPSNTKQLMALNLWDSANAGDYYEIAYQSNSSNTTFQTVAASGNIPQSPSIIVTVNQVR